MCFGRRQNRMTSSYSSYFCGSVGFVGSLLNRLFWHIKSDIKMRPTLEKIERHRQSYTVQRYTRSLHKRGSITLRVMMAYVQSDENLSTLSFLNIPRNITAAMHLTSNISFIDYTICNGIVPLQMSPPRLLALGTCVRGQLAPCSQIGLHSCR